MNNILIPEAIVFTIVNKKERRFSIEANGRYIYCYTKEVLKVKTGDVITIGGVLGVTKYGDLKIDGDYIEVHNNINA